MYFIKNSTYYFIIIVMYLIASIPVSPENAKKNSVETFLADVIKSNLFLKSKESSSRASHHAAKNSSRTYPDPEIMITRSNAKRDETAYIPDVNYQHSTTKAIEYRVLQPIPFPGRLTTEASVKKSDAKIADIELGLERNKMASDLLNILVDIERMENQIAITEQFQKKILVLSRIVSSRYGSGAGNLADITSVKLKAAEYADRIILLRGEYDAAKIGLNYYRDDRDYAISDEDLRNYFRKLREQIPGEDELAANSLELSLIRELQKKSRHEKNKSRLAFAPDFGVFAEYRKEKMKNEYLMYGNGKEEMYSMGVTIKIPLWSAFGSVSDYKEKDEKKRSADIEGEDLIRRLKYQYSSSRKIVMTSDERLELLNKSLIPQASLTVESARLSWEAKKTDFALLLDGYDSLYRQNMMRYDVESQMRKQIVVLAQIQNALLKSAGE